MASIPKGKYRTKAGSAVEMSGTFGGVSAVAFDWLEEANACLDCVVDPYPQEWDTGVYHLVWHCEYCQGGSALLIPVENEANS